MKRIKWLPSNSRAKTDQTTLTRWARKEISTEMAIEKIKKNNLLKELDKETFIENANSLGYFRDKIYTEGEALE